MPLVLRCRYARSKSDRVGKVKAGARGLLRPGSGDGDERDPMMLVVIRYEREELVAINHVAAQKSGIKVIHLLELGGAKHHMGKNRRAEHLRCGGIEVNCSRTHIARDWLRNRVESERGDSRD
jgi:hypothetical protein